MFKEKRHDHAQIGHDEDIVNIPLTPRIYPQIEEMDDHHDHHHSIEHFYFDIGGEG